MKNDFIKISIDKFDLEKKLSCDLFIHLPINNRMVKFLNAGEFLDPRTLQKFKDKGVPFLFASGDPNADPEKFELYQKEEVTNKAAIEPVAEFIDRSEAAPPSEPEIISETLPAVFSDSSEPETSTVLPSQEPLAEEEQKFSNEALAEEKTFIISGSQEEEDSPLYKFGNKLEELKESMISGTGSMSKADLDQLRDQAEKSFLVEKISEEIIKISANTQGANEEEQQRFKADIEKLDDTIRIISRGEKMPEELKQKFSVKADLDNFEKVFQSQKAQPEELIKISDRLAQIEEVRIKAKKAIPAPPPVEEISTGKLYMSARDTSSTVSALSISLAYNIGYMNHDFLTDLGTSVILYFAQLEGKKISQEKIPALSKCLFGTAADSSSTLEDTKLILGILEKYISSPECDRSKKDFEKPLFEKVCDAYFAENETGNAWIQEKWLQSMNRLATMEGHSLCTRSAARAIKQSREMIA